jgi:hypothetical protein
MSRDNRAGTDEYLAFGLRMLRSYGRRAAESGADGDTLAALAALAAECDRQMAETVRVMRSADGGAFSWAEIGDALGITRAAAFKRWGAMDPPDARRPGAQPSHLR